MERSATTGSRAREPLEEQSLAELTKRLTDQASSLAQKEAELAKAELALKGKRLGFGAGAFGASALLGLYALGALIATAILALAIVLDAWLAALIVAAGLGAAAGMLALAGKRKVEEGTPPVPEQAVESTKTDVEHTKRRAKEGRHD
jgi:Putative Actinobacterial Holin-X, holin superfamily III